MRTPFHISTTNTHKHKPKHKHTNTHTQRDIYIYIHTHTHSLTDTDTAHRPGRLLCRSVSAFASIAPLGLQFLGRNTRPWAVFGPAREVKRHRQVPGSRPQCKGFTSSYAAISSYHKFTVGFVCSLPFRPLTRSMRSHSFQSLPYPVAMR